MCQFLGIYLRQGCESKVLKYFENQYYFSNVLVYSLASSQRTHNCAKYLQRCVTDGPIDLTIGQMNIGRDLLRNDI